MLPVNGKQSWGRSNAWQVAAIIQFGAYIIGIQIQMPVGIKNMLPAEFTTIKARICLFMTIDKIAMQRIGKTFQIIVNIIFIDFGLIFKENMNLIQYIHIVVFFHL